MNSVNDKEAPNQNTFDAEVSIAVQARDEEIELRVSFGEAAFEVRNDEVEN